MLDLVVARLLAVSPYRFTVPNRPQDREIAYRLRYETVVAMGWADPATSRTGSSGTDTTTGRCRSSAGSMTSR